MIAYADDVVILAHEERGLVQVLRRFDKVQVKHGH